MKKNLAIKAENISKQYRLGEVGTGTITHDLNRFWAKIRGKEDPYLKIGEANDRSTKGQSDYVWSLRDINFEIEQGDAVGIIGRNGAGKSTLLKLLSKVTKPTTGSFKVNGRIASLLEVGTGFNPEMTGRENIYLNGAILGMRKHEIDRKFDEIVDFSGVERYIDTPVKRYSSGMYVRLAFAVAAHLESEILIVDEVLAVGDAEFQKKCLGKMGDVSKGEGRTVLFVSHNIDAVSKLCNNGIYLKNGKIAYQGLIGDTINQYLSENLSGSYLDINRKVNDKLFIQNIYIKSVTDSTERILVTGDKWKITLNIKVNEPIYNYVFAIGISTVTDTPINTTWSEPQSLEKGLYTICFINDEVFYQKGTYKVTLGISIFYNGTFNTIFYEQDILNFNIELISENLDDNLAKIDGTTGIIINQLKFKINKNVK